MKEHRQMVFKRRFCPKRDEILGGRRELHSEELHKISSSPNII
jgi:hypothetical protein